MYASMHDAQTYASGGSDVCAYANSTLSRYPYSVNHTYATTRAAANAASGSDDPITFAIHESLISGNGRAYTH